MENELLQDLLDRAAKGDEAALHALWLSLKETIRRRARSKLLIYGIRNSVESMDVFQSLMVDLLDREQRADLKSPEDLKRYLLRAVENKVIDALRRLTAQRRDERRNEPVPADEMDLAADESTPSSLAMRRELIERIGRSMTREEREIYDLTLEGLDWPDIGRKLGKSPDAVRMKLNRALQRIREEFGLED